MTGSAPEPRATPLPYADVETSSEDYARRFAGPVGRWFLEVQARSTLELLRPWPGGTVLDVGGGHGQVTGPLVEAGYRVTVYGSDDVCRERVRPWVDTGRARYQSGDLLRLPWPDAGVDLAVSYRLLSHLDRWEAALAELCRVARHAVVVDYPTTRSVNAVSGLLFGLKKSVEGNTRPFRVFREAEIRSALAGCSFQVTGRRPQFLIPMALHRGLRVAPLSRALEAAGAVLGLTRAFGSPVILRAERRG